jgi:hypothetical protein
MAKSEQPFDKIIKEKLDAFSPQDTPDWGFMQQKINDAEKDILFDHKIKEVFDDLKVDSPQIQWESFVSKRNRQIARRNKIISARVIESCLILLMFWTLDNIGITSIIKSNNQFKANPIAESNSHSSPKGNQTDVYQSDLNKTNEVSPITTHSNTDPKEKGFDRKIITTNHSLDENLFHKKLRKPSFVSNVAINSRHLQSDKNTDYEKTNSSPEASTESSNMITKENESTNQQITSSPGIENHTSLNDDELIPLDSKIDELPIEETKIELRDQLPVTLPALKPLIIHKSVQLNVHSGMMMNVILSPDYLNPNSDKLYSQLRPGFQTAVNLGFKTKKYMLESGLAYQYLTYEPNQSDQLGSFENGYFKLHFQKITSHIVTIPVLVHFDLIKARNWSISSKAGLSLSAALVNNFELDTIFTEKQGTAKIFDLTNSEINARVRNSSNQGILDGGDFGINSFSNIVLGIRYQRQFSSRLSIYTEFEISKMLGEFGFGPNGDRFISGNINTGVSFRL